MNKYVKALLIGGGITAIAAAATAVGVVYGVVITGLAYAQDPEKTTKDLNEIGTKLNEKINGKKTEEEVCEEEPAVKIEITQT